MGRPEPCVLFSQSFVHPHLDEYVDEIIFAEPVVITACEFLEQNASSASSLVTVIGATSPPSFALEVFVQCEGEAQFRRLCQPFLYSHSSSNVLEVEAVVTNHLVVRGSYRSLTLVIYGNTAEDLGQFNIDFDLDSSLASLVSTPSEGRLEDLPSALWSSKLTLVESLCSLKSLSFPAPEIELPIEVKKLLFIIHKLFQLGDLGDSSHKVVNTVVSSVSSYIYGDLLGTVFPCNRQKEASEINCRKDYRHVAEAQIELLDIYKMLQHASGDELEDPLGHRTIFESEAEVCSPKLFDVFIQCFFLKEKSLLLGLHCLSENEKTVLGLCLVFLFCHGNDTCFHFVNGGGLREVASIFCNEAPKSTAVTLMLLGVVERVTRHAIGCEGFLGWCPRQDENVPTCSSEGYTHLVRLLLKRQRHDVASLGAFLLHRLRFFEIASRYESAVLSVLERISADDRVTQAVLKSLVLVDSQLKQLLKLLKMWEPVEDISPLACVARSSMLLESEGMLSYKSTVNLIAASKCHFGRGDIDTTLLSLLKERGFLLLSCALLSSPIAFSENGSVMDVFVDIAASIEAVVLSLLSSRSGLVFLLHQTEVAIALVLALKGTAEMDKAECVPLRYANVLVAKGFLCRTLEVGVITELHLKVVNAVDRLLTATSHSEEFLWILWELCALSRSDAGRQALLALGRFPEVILALIQALHSVKELQPAAASTGTSPIDLAILHSAAEIFEVMVTDPMPSSLASWIGHSVELHKALHSSSPGSNWRDAPTRLLEWIDAGVVYHRSGAVGLLRYAAVLASGGDAQLSSASVLVSDSIDVENVIGDSSSGSDVQVVENLLGKLVSDKYFEGIVLRDSSIAQLTTAFRILAFIAENPSVAAALYEENAVTIIYVIVVNCKFMLELSSNTYDYLIDEGPESNSTSNLLTERGREQSLIDLMIPTLSLLITLLQKLQEAKEPHRNTKLLKALLSLHKEVSPKLAASAADMSSPYPRSALGLGAVCRLIVSALASWPIFGWSPGLFLSLLESVQTSSQLALGPKEACSFLWILGDLFPGEDIWLWRNGIPSLSVLRTLSVAVLLGEEREKDIDWYLQPARSAALLGRLAPFLDNIAQVVVHFAFSALAVVRDMLRVLIIRIASQKVEFSVLILQPIITWMNDCIVMSSPLSDTHIYKVGRLLEFIASLLEHPCSKVLLLKEDMIQVLSKALESCYVTFTSDVKHPTNSGMSLLLWFHPICKSLALICDSKALAHHSEKYDKSLDSVTVDNWSFIECLLLKICQILPAGSELLACLVALKRLACYSPSRKAFSLMLQSETASSTYMKTEKEHDMDGKYNANGYDWKLSAPLLCCLRNLLQPLSWRGSFSVHTVEAVKELLLFAICLCEEDKDLEGLPVIKFLFGSPQSSNALVDSPKENLKDARDLLALLNENITIDEHLSPLNESMSLYQVRECIETISPLLQEPVTLIKEEKMVANAGFRLCQEVLHPSKLIAPHIHCPPIDDEAGISLSRLGKFTGTDNAFCLDGLTERYLWECPDTLPDKLVMGAIPTKRKNASVEGPNRRARGDSSVVEYMGPNNFPRGMGGTTLPSGSTRRDTFRQRKPNTSRPPSMHVDDYVARERNFDGASGSNVVGSVHRGISGGRPPSIHVDEFMARQRERQNPCALPVGEVMDPQSRSLPAENESASKVEKSRQLKADLDDDLQEIDIVFDVEPESDDKLPFPQSDDTPGPPPLLVGGDSPRSIVEETENDQTESSRIRHLSGRTSSDAEVDSHEDFAMRSEASLTREESINSVSFPPSNKGKSYYYYKQSDEIKHLKSSKTALPPVSTSTYNKDSTLSPLPRESRLPPVSFSLRDSPKQAANVLPSPVPVGFYDKKVAVNQPPLPPLPPPSTIPTLHSQHAERLQSQLPKSGPSPLPSSYPLQTFDTNGPNTVLTFTSPFPDALSHPIPLQLNADFLSTNTSGVSLTSLQPMLDSRYAWASVSSSGKLNDDTLGPNSSLRPPQPPLPPMPPPHTAQNSSSQMSPYNPSNHRSQLQLPLAPLSDGRLGVPYSLPALTPPMMISKPTSSGGSLFVGSTLQQQQNLNSASPSSLLPSLQTVMQSFQLQPPSQPLRPHPPSHPRPPDQLTGLQQSPIHAHTQLLQPPQQLQIPQRHVYYQTQNQQQDLSQTHHHHHHQQQQGDNVGQQHDSGVTLQHFFSSPETIQSLLNDREKLCQLLEQHPKLMQMLQEKLGQL